MKAFLATTCIVTGAMLAGGCATKKYVRNTTAPIQAKVKQVDEKAQSGISAAQERASAADQHAAQADQHAGEAMNKANQANQLGEQNQQALTTLRGTLSKVVSNIDDYQLQTSVAVPFKFDKYSLTDEAKGDLDKLASDVKSDKRFFIAVEGYTDKTGARAYNEALSRR